MSRILVVEDEQHLADGLRYNLEAEQYDVDLVDNGEEALQRLTAEPSRYDLVILDVMLPGIDGFARRDRAARGAPVRAGADADRARPIGGRAARLRRRRRRLPAEAVRAADSAVARARAAAPPRVVSRRRPRAQTSPPVASQFSFGDKSIDFEQLEVRVGDKRMPLTLMEAALLRYFVQHEGSPVPRKEILEKVWGVHEDTDTRAIDNFIVRLRRYIEDEPSSPRHLQTVRGVGYRFVANPE